MKYIDAEKLSAQIEKLFPDSSDERIVEGFEYALDKVKAIIDSLQQEQPEVDLKKDVESWFFNEVSSKINVEHTMYHYFQECAHRYYNLGLNAKKKD